MEIKLLSCSIGAALSLALALSVNHSKTVPRSSIEPVKKETESKFVRVSKEGNLIYVPDEKGNIIPDFSRVGFYAGDREIPDIPVVKTVSATGTEQDQQIIQDAINEVGKRDTGANGFRGAILLKKGVYKIASTLHIDKSGVVLRGEGDDGHGTNLLFTATRQLPLIVAAGTGNLTEVTGTRTKITDDYVPVGTTSFHIATAGNFKVGDKIIVYRPGTQQWITDLQMDKIDERGGTKQWQPAEYNFTFERVIVKIEGNTIFIDNPIVMAMETKYGGGEIYKYRFESRIRHVGIEHLFLQSAYATDTSEDHGWDAISYEKLTDSWVRQVTSKYFGYSCVNLGKDVRNVSVLNSTCLDAKSIITGGRRYSFNNGGQLNLFMNCHTTEGRHDYVTGAKVHGPNVFVNCTAANTHADIGPHHRWSMGTLFDNIVTDGEINIQDRGNWGSGHGWAGVTQVVWNCTVKRAAVQNPWVSGKNYVIGLKGGKYEGRLKGRPDGEWDEQNKTVQPASLYLAQLQERKRKKA
jgi:hypothetical protein